MKEIHDELIVAMCQAFVNNHSSGAESVVTTVWADGDIVIIHYRFPCTTGWKCSEWHTNMLELMAFVWSQQP